ncbi:MAG TPA: prolipoprotein diacylglyceryl transferase [Candidatus Atribacteria bacterium]|nr:prolipoprotein diacylglyceryl transferase [Candidatus Atribacteria bacterium]
MYRILFTVGSFPVYSYGVMIALAFIMAILLAMKEAKRYGENPERVLDISLYVILGALIGGRLGYILQYLDYYLKNPLKILYFRQGGLSFLGGFLVAYFLCWLYVKRTKISFWKYADIAAPSIAIGLGIGRIGCFLNGCCFGVVSENYGIEFPSLHMPPVYLQQLKDGLIASGSSCTLPVIPTQIYASLCGFLIFFILHWMKKYKKYDGFLMLNFFILYSISRFTIEFFRFYENNYKIFNLLTVTQAILLGVVLVSLVFMSILKKKAQKHN